MKSHRERNVNRNRESPKVLLIFGRYPRTGRIKTRLAESIGPMWTERLYRAMLKDTLHRLASLEGLRIILYLSDCSRDEVAGTAEELTLPARTEVRVQQGRDLGERMLRAAEENLQPGSRVVIVGTDSPTLPLQFVRDAFAALLNRPVVLGPGRDGGYYLIGLSGLRPQLFQDIPWGTSAVFERSCELLLPHEVDVLPEWYDIDTAADLLRLRAELTGDKRIDAPRTAHILDQIPGFRPFDG